MRMVDILGSPREPSCYLILIKLSSTIIILKYLILPSLNSFTFSPFKTGASKVFKSLQSAQTTSVGR
jgi:hypothetical protein